MKLLGRTLLIAAFCGSILTVPAWAASVKASYGSAWSSGSILYVKDTAGDGLAVYAPYIKAGASGVAYVYNRSGAWTTVSRNVGSAVKAVKICTENWGPDKCSGWR